MAEVVIPVERWPGRREVAVRVNLVGQPASGYRLEAIKVEPNTVVLRGDSDLVNEVPGFVETQPLSVEGAMAEVRSRVSLIIPPGVTSSEGDIVDVTAAVVPVEDSDRITLKPTVRGTGLGLDASVALDTVDVIVSGPQTKLASLGPDDIFVILDLTGLLPGSHVLEPKVLKPDDIRLEGVLPETVEVVITELATPTPIPTPTSTVTPTLEVTATPTATSVTGPSPSTTQR
jgi:YbbR domain-containing protein